MLVRNWMSTDLVTVSPTTSLKEAVNLMKEHGIRCLPVLGERRRVLGIISDRDLKAASPSKVTTMDVHEVHYLFNHLRAKDIMTTEVITITTRDTVEKAAVIMHRRKISSLPVVEKGEAVGIITQDDVARVLTSITGIYRGGTQFALSLADQPRAVPEVLEVIRGYGAEVVSVLSIHDIGKKGCQYVYIRAGRLDREMLRAISKELESRFTLRYVAEDELADLEDGPPAPTVPRGLP